MYHWFRRSIDCAWSVIARCKLSEKDCGFYYFFFFLVKEKAWVGANLNQFNSTQTRIQPNLNVIGISKLNFEIQYLCNGERVIVQNGKGESTQAITKKREICSGFVKWLGALQIFHFSHRYRYRTFVQWEAILGFLFDCGLIFIVDHPPYMWNNKHVPSISLDYLKIQ